MSKIWFTSDLHFGHDKEFVWEARGFENIEEMNQAIVERFNSMIAPEDTLYILGDIMLNDNEVGEKYLSQLNGKKIIILGNHDTATRIEIYKKYAEKVVYADVLKYKKKLFYLSHYPTLTGNGDELYKTTINLHGHTHQTSSIPETLFWATDLEHSVNMRSENLAMYHVGVDSHNCYPVLLDDIIEEIKAKRVKREENKNETKTN